MALCEAAPSVFGNGSKAFQGLPKKYSSVRVVVSRSAKKGTTPDAQVLDGNATFPSRDSSMQFSCTLVQDDSRRYKEKNFKLSILRLSKVAFRGTRVIGAANLNLAQFGTPEGYSGRMKIDVLIPDHKVRAGVWIYLESNLNKDATNFSEGGSVTDDMSVSGASGSEIDDMPSKPIRDPGTGAVLIESEERGSTGSFTNESSPPHVIRMRNPDEYGVANAKGDNAAARLARTQNELVAGLEAVLPRGSLRGSTNNLNAEISSDSSKNTGEGIYSSRESVRSASTNNVQPMFSRTTQRASTQGGPNTQSNTRSTSANVPPPIPIPPLPAQGNNRSSVINMSVPPLPPQGNNRGSVMNMSAPIVPPLPPQGNNRGSVMNMPSPAVPPLPPQGNNRGSVMNLPTPAVAPQGNNRASVANMGTTPVVRANVQSALADMKLGNNSNADPIPNNRSSIRSSQNGALEELKSGPLTRVATSGSNNTNTESSEEQYGWSAGQNRASTLGYVESGEVNPEVQNYGWAGLDSDKSANPYGMSNSNRSHTPTSGSDSDIKSRVQLGIQAALSAQNNSIPSTNTRTPLKNSSLDYSSSSSSDERNIENRPIHQNVEEERDYSSTMSDYKRGGLAPATSIELRGFDFRPSGGATRSKSKPRADWVPPPTDADDEDSSDEEIVYARAPEKKDDGPFFMVKALTNGCYSCRSRVPQCLENRG